MRVLKIKKLAGRCLAFLLAGTFLFSEASPLLGAVQAAEEGEALELKYMEGKELSADIIRGDTVDILANNTRYYAIKNTNGGQNGNNGLLIYPEGSSTPVLDLFRITGYKKRPDGNSEEFTLLSEKEKDAAGKVIDSQPVYYRVNANYYAQKKSGRTVQQSSGAPAGSTGSNNVGGSLVLAGASANTYLMVEDTAEGILTCMPDGSLTIGFSGDVGQPFKDWQPVVVVQSAGAQVGDVSNKPLTYRLLVQEPGRSIEFDFTPNSYWSVLEQATNPDGSPKVDEFGNPVMNPSPTRYYGLRSGDSFRVIFDFVKSQDLGLQVHSQSDALAEEVDNVVNSKSIHDDTGYINLDNPDDRLYFVTGNFQLRRQTEIYGRGVLLSWKFFVKNESGNFVEDTSQDLIEFTGQGRSWMDATVKPRVQDVEGYLEVTADYEDPSFFPINPGDQSWDGQEIRTKVTRQIPITLHGTGVSGKVEKLSYTIGESGNPVELLELPKKEFTMDLYQGDVPGYDKQPEGPSKVVFTISPGSENGFAEQLIIESSTPEALKATIMRGTNGTPVEYTWGSVFKNDGNKERPDPIILTVEAQTPGTMTTLNFRYFIEGPDANKPIEDPNAARQTMTIRVVDSSPDNTAQLAELILQNSKTKDPIPGFTFQPEVYEDASYNLELDYEIDKVVFKPKVIDSAQRDIGVFVETYNDQGQWVEAGEEVWNKKQLDTSWYEDYQDFLNGNTDKALTSFKSHRPAILSSGITLNLEPGQRVRVRLKVRAQNPNTVGTYVFILTRNLPSDDSTLKTLTFVDEEGTEYTVPLEPGKMEYSMRLPFRIKQLQVLPELNHPGAVLTDKSYNPELERKGMFGSKNWLNLNYSLGPDGIEQMLFTIHIDAQNQIAEDASDYAITFLRDEPSHVSTATNLEVTDAEGNALTLDPAFSGVLEDENGAYTVRVPYIMDKVRLRLTTDDPYSTARMEYWVNNTQKDQTLVTGGLSKAIDVPVMSESAPYYEITVIVTAEDGKSSTTYKVRIERAEPDKDAYLAGLELKDLAGEIQEFEDPFDPEVTTYEATVLYATDKVTVTPTTSSSTATVRVNGRKVESGQPSNNIKVKYPGYEEIEVEVTAQDGETVMLYKIRVKRAEPSSDSRLRALEVSDVDRLKPVFSPKTLHYTANVNEGVTEVTVTATTNDPFATLQIDGKNATSGQPSEPIVLLDVYQTVTVVVTAQDGKNSTTYEVVLYNTNMVEKSSNADLSNLKVIEGQMEPGFAPSVLTYEVYVKEDLNSVEIIPTPADPMAKVQVFAGTLEIGDEEGNYEYAIVDGENTFSVRVTAPDESKYKDYTIIVYRNEEGKMGFLRPITAEDIDFENSGDIILVDITKYPRVAADVFNTLKTEYPEKTIIFEGNDYSLQFDGADIEKIIPHTEVFDFSLSFDSPYRSEIMRKIRRYSANDDARIVLVHFGDNKELPAPARFTLSLGRKYRDDQLYWHYWNQERERIDYYGTVDTNSKGTFAVKLERLGDYIIADQRLAGSEDKSTSIAGDGDLTKDTSLLKTNPSTGEREGGQ